MLYRGGRRFVFVLAEQALRTTVGDDDVMAGQLDRLLAVMSTARVVVGIVPASASYRVPTNQFILFDGRTVNVETVSAELTITQPREIALYAAAFEQIWAQATPGDAARTLIRSALQQRNPPDPHPCTSPHTCCNGCAAGGRVCGVAGRSRPRSDRWGLRQSRPSFCTASRSSPSSATLASIFDREKSSISRPWTIFHSPFSEVTGNEEMRPSGTP